MSQLKKKIAVVIAVTLLPLLIALLWMQPAEAVILTVVSTYLVFVGLVFVFYQIKINLNYNKRKAATDFMFEEVIQILQPVEERLKEMLGKEFLIFEQGEDYERLLRSDSLDEQTKSEMRKVVIGILNFYERMAISIFKGTFDEDICYDDKGLLVISFYGWTENYIHTLRRTIEDRACANGVVLAQKWSERYKEHADRIRKGKSRQAWSTTIDNREIA